MEEVTGATDAAATCLWMESLIWVSECFNWSATAANDGGLSPHDIFYGNRPPLAPLQPAYHRVPRQRKSDPRARLCYFLNFDYNHGYDCHKLLDAEAAKVVFSRDVTWHHLGAPLIPPATAVGNPPAALPEDIYVPMPTPVPSVAAPALATVLPATASATTLTPVPAHAPTPASTMPPPPTSMMNCPAPIPPRVSRKLAHEEYVEIPGGRVTRPVHCAIHHGNTPIAMLYQWIMRPWCQCWKRVKRYTKFYANTVPLRTCRPHMRQNFIL